MGNCQVPERVLQRLQTRGISFYIAFRVPPWAVAKDGRCGRSPEKPHGLWWPAGFHPYHILQPQRSDSVQLSKRKKQILVRTVACAGLASLSAFFYAALKRHSLNASEATPVASSPSRRSVVKSPILELFPSREAAVAHLEEIRRDTGGYAIDFEWAGRYQGGGYPAYGS